MSAVLAMEANSALAMAGSSDGQTPPPTANAHHWEPELPILDNQHSDLARRDLDPVSEQIDPTLDVPSEESDLSEPHSTSPITRPALELRQLQPSGVLVSQETLSEITATLSTARKAGLPDLASPLVEAEQDFEPHHDRKPLEDPGTVSLRLFEEYRQLIYQSPRRERIEELKTLPMNAPDMWRRILDMVRDADISIIVGTTGSGKTTQVPQLILNHAIMDKKGAYCNIICTQPRRIATTSVARRVVYERNEPIQKSIGYQIRYGAKLPEYGGSITYCTTGQWSSLPTQARARPKACPTAG
jgi:hypothetical protein